jgi:hypothetical protein
MRVGVADLPTVLQDRKHYLDALESASLTEDLGPFQLFTHQRLGATLDDYLAALGP